MSALLPPAQSNAFPSRKRIAPFTLHRPASIGEALELHRTHEGAAFYGGGVDMMNHLKAGRAVEHLVHLGRVAALRDVARHGRMLRIGSGLTHAEAARAVQTDLPELAALIGCIANVRIRWAGTLGGNVMSGDPAYEVLPAMAALGARLVFADDAGERTVPAAGYDGSTGLLVAFDVPLAPQTKLLFDRTYRPVAGVTIGVTIEGAAATRLRVAAGCAYARPVCIEQAFDAGLEVARAAAWAPGVAAAAAAALPEPMTDWIASGRYRRRLIGVVVHRLLAALGRSA